MRMPKVILAAAPRNPGSFPEVFTWVACHTYLLSRTSVLLTLSLGPQP
jgi:hypothetical protein